MVKGSSSTNKGLFEAAVRVNKRIGERYYRLGLEFEGAGAKAFGGAEPGQFSELDLSGVSVPSVKKIPEELRDSAGRNILLRRPFSFADIEVRDNKTEVEIVYCVVGPASLRMTTLAAGDTVSVIGPLGQGFSVPEGKRRALLVAGGMGAPPLQHLAKVLTEEHGDIEVIAFAGAKTVKDLPFKAKLDEISQGLGFSLGEFAKFGVKSMVATDDGSAGFEGLVSDCFAEWLGHCKWSAKDMIIYGCGPEGMLAKVSEIARERKIDCQVSMERRMACGIGVCMSCAVECKVEGSNKSIYKLCCKDGPVFDGAEVVWSI
ncbi:MAG: dihydroorotate dehydrogenase electron transfer subunit [Planctomycetota bacterium]|jgi:dihydroorotate dehydrogenase electron transfer subunit